MPKGATSRKRIMKEIAAAKKEARRAAKQQSENTMAKSVPSKELCIPTVSEDDLLAFQFAHFGDDSRPDAFFVDPNTALNFEAQDPDNEDGLGWYQDGTKRMLTDEDIAWFRKQELLQMLARREQNAPIDQSGYTEEDGPDAPQSPASDASSMEAELLGLAQTMPVKKQPFINRETSQDRRSNSTRSSSTATKKQPRREQIPYEQRHKRKWENYIDGQDPSHGSMTHRRLAREMDVQHAREVEMDYGDSVPAAGEASMPASTGSALVSYADD